MTVAAILKHKGSKIASTRADVTLGEVARQLSEARIGAVVVLDGDALLGIVSERDIVHALASNGAVALGMTAGQVMTRAVKTARPGTTVEQAMALMTAGRFRHLPVLEQEAPGHDVLVGIISIGDVVKARMMQQDHEVDSLKAYVAGVG